MSKEVVGKYKAKRMITLFDHLFLTDDIIYIQCYDPSGGRPQRVFTEDKTLLGTISSDYYWKLKDSIELLEGY